MIRSELPENNRLQPEYPHTFADSTASAVVAALTRSGDLTSKFQIMSVVVPERPTSRHFLVYIGEKVFSIVPDRIVQQLGARGQSDQYQLSFIARLVDSADISKASNLAKIEKFEGRYYYDVKHTILSYLASNQVDFADEHMISVPAMIGGDRTRRWQQLTPFTLRVGYDSYSIQPVAARPTGHHEQYYFRITNLDSSGLRPVNPEHRAAKPGQLRLATESQEGTSMGEELGAPTSAKEREQMFARAAGRIIDAVKMFESDTDHEGDTYWNIWAISRITTGGSISSAPMGIRISAEIPGNSKQNVQLQINFDEHIDRLRYSVADWQRYIRALLENNLAEQNSDKSRQLSTRVILKLT